MSVSRLSDRGAIGVALTIYGLLTGATTLVREPLHDEGVTWDQVFGPFPIEPGARPVSALWPARPLAPTGVVDALSERGLHPPASFLLLACWARVAGADLFLLRLPGVLFGGLTVVGLGRLAGLVGGADVAKSAMLIGAASPWLGHVAAFARPYSLAVALSVWTSCLLLAAARAPRTRDGALYLVLSLIGLYSVYHYVFVVAAQVVCWMAASSLTPKARMATLTIGAATLAAAYTPWLRVAEHHFRISGRAFYFSGPLTVGGWFRGGAGLIRRLLFPNVASELAWVLTLILGVLVIGSAAKGRALWRASGIVLTYAAILATFVLLADIVHGSHTLLLPHIAFGLFPPLVIVLATLTTPTGARSAVPVLLGAGLLLSLGGQWLNPSSLWRAAERVSTIERRSHVIVAGPALRGALYPFVWNLLRAGASDAALRVAPADPGPATQHGGGSHVTVVRFTPSSPRVKKADVTVIEGWPPPFIE